MIAIYRKELKSAMRGVTGPIFMALIFGIISIFVLINNFLSGYPHLEYAMVSAVFWTLMFVPLITMRSFAEERSNKTDKLLYFLPVSGTQVTLGKYLAMITIFAIPCLACCAYPIILSTMTDGAMPWLLSYNGILVYFLAGCTVIAICMFISTLFESQIITAVVSLAVLILLYILGNFTQSLTGIFGTIVSSICIFQKVNDITYGYVDITCIVYYLSIAVMFVFFSILSFERRRWK